MINKRFTSFTRFAVLLLLLVPSLIGRTGWAQGYPYASSMALNQSDADRELRASYVAWRDAYVSTSGAGGFRRVVRWGTNDLKKTEDDNDTVSEGIGYGMVLAAYMDDRAVFDDLWNYAKSHLDQFGLMHWEIDQNNKVAGTYAATDGDEDMALALIVADRRWGGSYGVEARALISRILQYEVTTDNYLLPGDGWGAIRFTSPCYFAPAYYRTFGQYAGETRWNNVTTRCYEVLAALNGRTGAGQTGLMPDWSTFTGDPAPGQNFTYSYDACRTPWRLAKDAAWFGDLKARAQLDKLNAFWAAQGVSNIKSGYTLAGTPTVSYGDAAFVVMAATGAIVSPDAKLRQDFWEKTVALRGQGYYHDTLRLLALLFMSGNMPNPLTIGATTATATATPSTIAPGGSTSIRVSVSAGQQAFSGVVNIETFDASGARVGQKFFEQENIAAGQTRTYEYVWTAPDATGEFTVKVGLFRPSWSGVVLWNDRAAIISVSAPDTAQYNFESGAQSWGASSGALITGVASTTIKPYRGTRSLAVTFGGQYGGTQRVLVPAPPVAAGCTITFRVWLPRGSAITAVQPYVLEGAAGGWKWTGNWQPISNLRPGEWNTLTLAVPANAAPLAELGVEFATSGGWSGTCYVDAVDW